MFVATMWSTKYSKLNIFNVKIDQIMFRPHFQESRKTSKDKSCESFALNQV